MRHYMMAAPLSSQASGSASDASVCAHGTEYTLMCQDAFPYYMELSQAGAYLSGLH
jgi:hypothetical protein